jgi:hypothetical protein
LWKEEELGEDVALEESVILKWKGWYMDGWRAGESRGG